MARGRYPSLDTGRPNIQRGPVEQQTMDDAPAFEGGGRRADIPGDYQQREAADTDYNANLARTARQDKEALGQKTDTPWVKGGSGRRKGI